MLTSRTPPPVPAPVKQASGLMLSYALVVLISTLVFAFQNDFTEPRMLFRGLLRTVGMTTLGIWILTLDKTAWRLAVIACGFLAVIGCIGTALLVIVGVATDPSILLMVLQYTLPLYLVTHSAIILGRRSTRAHFVSKKERISQRSLGMRMRGRY